MRSVRFLVVLSIVGLATLTGIALRPSAEETDSLPPPKVSDLALETVIGVYSAMQMDHDLTIERALEPHALTVESFRQIERRVQAEQRLVDKVRQALLVQVQSRSVFTSGAAPATGPVLAEPRTTPSPAKP
jgi:hypothetical protein